MDDIISKAISDGVIYNLKNAQYNLWYMLTESGKQIIHYHVKLTVSIFVFESDKYFY